MRADERKGAWVMIGIIAVLGIILWLLGKCQGFSENSAGFFPGGVEVHGLTSDSVESGDIMGGDGKGENKKRKGRVKTSLRYQSGRGIGEPVRDILADSIPMEDVDIN